MQWKRNHHRKIEEKFRKSPSKEEDDIKNDEANTKSNTPIWDQKQLPKPLAIDGYEEVQPMWINMESRVTKRQSLTLDQRGGVSGRRNVRKSEEDMWLEAGVYDSDKKE